MNNDTIHPVHAVYDGLFNSTSGKLVSLINPKPEQICLSDIARGLTNICRFGGQLQHFHSVAKHTLLVWFLAPENLKQVALLHDASEAYLGDVIKPLKVLIADVYGPFEEMFTNVIFHKYQVDVALMEEIKFYDDAALNMEHRFHRGADTFMRTVFKSINEQLGDDSTHNQLLSLLTQNFGQYDERAE